MIWQQRSKEFHLANEKMIDELKVAKAAEEKRDADRQDNEKIEQEGRL